MVTPQHFVHRLVSVPRITQWVVPKPSLACRSIHSWAKSIWLLKQPQPTLNFYLFYIGCSLVRPKWWANSTWHIVEGKTDLMSLIGLLQHPTLGTLRSNDATATRTSLKKWICVISVFIAIIPTHLLCQLWANPPKAEFQGAKFKLRKRNKISSLLVYVLHKTRN